MIKAGVPGVKQILGQPVDRVHDPVHVIRTGPDIAQAVALNVYGDVQSANTFVAFAAPRVYCAS